MPAFRRAFKAVDQVISGGAKKFTKMAGPVVGAKALKATEGVRNSVRSNRMVKTFFKEDTPGIWNAGLGIKMRPGWGVAIGVGMTAAGGVSGALGGTIRNSEFGPAKNPYYAGNIPMLDYDASGNGDITGNRGLGATGDIVFGLNAGRKG